ncbi:hypothetical protein F503_06063 [Ophiostoma piceae UAMH 11346]|uniref:Uncharacterized protein n=1 Tax=Ophiostoma piceae (strain UAMH 11346) TaxID=1262450 RepID=S3CW65_OPHP1|nr:hypothetical protein F503_06063 [Ophiostoma piceae UAMH 11346]
MGPAERGVMRQTCFRFMQIVHEPVSLCTPWFTASLQLHTSAKFFFEFCKRSRFNAYPIHPQYLTKGEYGDLRLRRSIREAQLRRELCKRCLDHRESLYSGVLVSRAALARRGRRYCTDCEMYQPESAFGPESRKRCRMKDATIKLCEHETRGCLDIALAANAAIDLRVDRGINLYSPECDANAEYGPRYHKMTHDHAKNFQENNALEAPRSRASRPPTPDGGCGWNILGNAIQYLVGHIQVLAASIHTRNNNTVAKSLMPQAWEPRNLASAVNGEYTEIFRCQHTDHHRPSDRTKPKPATYDSPRIVMSHAVDGYAERSGALTMIWAGHMFDIADAKEGAGIQGLTRDKLREMIANLSVDKVPTICPHVKQLGMKQLALAFDEYRCACFDAPRDTADDAMRPLKANPHPWSARSWHIADYQREPSDCTHRPGFDRCCRCYNDDRPGARHTSPRTLMPEWTGDGVKETPAALHAYRCDMCATEYRWQRAGKSIFLETRKAITTSLEFCGRPRSGKVPPYMFAQFVDPDTMYQLPSRPRWDGNVFCDDRQCYVRTCSWAWLDLMFLDSYAYIGREEFPKWRSRSENEPALDLNRLGSMVSDSTRVIRTITPPDGYMPVNQMQQWEMDDLGGGDFEDELDDELDWW